MKFLHYMCLLLLPTFVFASENDQDELLCRQCGHEITLPSDLANIDSPFAIDKRNETMAGVSHVLVQLVQTSEGDLYEIITTTHADALVIGDWMEENTWYPDYLWKIGICPHCGTQLGWVFDKPENSMEDGDQIFMALITHRLISRDCKFISTLHCVSKVVEQKVEKMKPVFLSAYKPCSKCHRRP